MRKLTGDTHKVDLQGFFAWSHLNGEGLGLQVTLLLIEPIVFSCNTREHNCYNTELRELTFHNLHFPKNTERTLHTNYAPKHLMGIATNISAQSAFFRVKWQMLEPGYVDKQRN